MLTEQSAKTLGYKKQFRHKINSPSFVSTGVVWNKTKGEFPVPFNILNKKHIYNYSKKGKMFGFDTKRYIEYYNGILLYFQDENDKEYKGYCFTQNLYMYFIPLSSNQHLLHLTNGNEWSQFYFNDHLFFNSIAHQLRKDVVQLNFYEKYNITQMIGKGTYSKVYLAKNKEDNNKYAVKIVGKKDKNGSDTKNIVDQQKKIFRVLDSQYVCRMIQFFQEDDAFIFVLQLLTGRDLMSFYRQKVQLSFKQIIHIFKGVLLGIAHLHSNKIMHRDLKPQNIMVDDVTLNPKLIDFGLSLLYNSKTDKKRFKRCGTMGYMAYEVIHNTMDKKKTYDCKCDMFSFGIIAHMMLLGYNPIKGGNYNETVKKNEECNIVLQKQVILQKYGPHCLNFLMGLLEKDPNKRLSAQQALKSSFLEQQILQNKQIFKNHIEETTEEKEDDAHFQYQDQQVTIPKFQNFDAKKVNLQNRF